MVSSSRSQPLLSKNDLAQTVASRIKKAGEPGDVTYVSEDSRILIEDEGKLVQ